MPKPARVLVLVLAALALVAAGCGGDTDKKNDYVNAVNAAQTKFQTTFDRLQADITATSTPRQDRATLDRFRKAVDTVVAELRAIKPPGSVKTLHSQLISQVSGYGAEIDRAKTAFASRDPQKVIAANTKFASAVTKVSQKITATIDAINKRLHE
jgi:hypothetical protein